MKDEVAVLLQVIRDELEKQGPTVVGHLVLTDETLSILDGKAKLSAVIHDDPGAHPAVAHCHIIADTSVQGGSLDACVVGAHSDRREALADAGRTWVETVAAPFLSLMHARPVMEAAHFDGFEGWGVSGCHGFVGPIRARFFERPFDLAVFSDAPVFEYAAEMAPPGAVHLAKVTLQAIGNGGWNRTLDVDGHSASHEDHPWDIGLAAPSQGIASIFAVFHYGDQPASIKARQKTDEAIRRFVSAFQATGNPEKAANYLRDEGIEADLVHQVATLAPLAFGRMVVASIGASCAPDFIRVRRDGTVEQNVRLMHQPVFARSMALTREFMNGEFLDAVKRLSLESPEVRVINDALLSGSKPSNLKVSSPIIPDPEVSANAVERAIGRLRDCAQQNRTAVKIAKRWWKFW